MNTPTALRHAITNMRLHPILSSVEVWSFGFTGLLLWIVVAPVAHAGLGALALLMWVPITCVGMIIVHQVRHMAMYWPEMAGGTPNYTARLLKEYPWFGRYAALAYFQAWAAVPTVSAILLTELIKVNLSIVDFSIDETWLKTGLTFLGFVVAFAGIRALSVLHMFYFLPAIGFLLAFCIEGLVWVSSTPLIMRPIAADWTQLKLVEWAKWYFVATFAVYAVETASSFMADSRKPAQTLRSMTVAIWLMPIVFIGGSWLLSSLVSNPNIAGNMYLTLLNATMYFWGKSSFFLVIFLITSSCLLTSATACANTPRILYQLAQDGHIAPVFGVVSRRGVPIPALILVMGLSILGLFLGDLLRVLMVAATGYFFAFIAMHFGLWLNRNEEFVKWPWLALGLFFAELFIFVLGGLSWSSFDFLMGLLFPFIIMGLDWIVRRVPLEIFQPNWWADKFKPKPYGQMKDGLSFQVTMLLVLICGAVSVGWSVSALIDGFRVGNIGANLFAILLELLGFLGVAVACWTTIPQVASIAEAREQAVSEAHHLLTSALDAILVVDDEDIIRSANPAAENLFSMDAVDLVGHPLVNFLPALASQAGGGPRRSEHILEQSDGSARHLVVSVSTISGTPLSEHAVILHDISNLKAAESALKASLAETASINQALTQANRELLQKNQENEMFVYSVSHDLRSPLVNLQGFSQELSASSKDLHELLADPAVPVSIQQRARSILDEDVKDAVRFIQAAVSRLSNIIDALLRLSRAGRLEYHFQSVDMDATIRRIVDAMNATINQRGAEVVVRKLPGAYADPTAMEQVFANLLSNALNYLNPRRLGLIEIGVQAQDDAHFHTYFVRDNGLGIPVSAQKKIFHIFQRFHPEAAKGEGVGLSIVRRVVERHGGSIWYESEEGEGTTFFVKLPNGPSSQTV